MDHLIEFHFKTIITPLRRLISEGAAGVCSALQTTLHRGSRSAMHLSFWILMDGNRLSLSEKGTIGPLE